MTKAICFFNNGTLDKRAFTMLGLSAKSDDKAIGFFGTGFKYAIASLLRHGAEVHIVTKEDQWVFYTTDDEFRGKEIEVIHAHHMATSRSFELPFTTHLGANWKLWQAYRELYTNALDEGGGCMFIPDYLEYGDNQTHDVCVYVVDDEFGKLYDEHDKYFLKSKTLEQSRHLRCVTKVENSDNVVYYKTMYTGTRLDKPTLFTYDYITTVDLTEDRTIADTWTLRHHISNLWIEHMSEEFLKLHLPMVAKEKLYENQLSSDYCSPSDAFQKACAYLIKHKQSMPLWALDTYNKHRPFDETVEYAQANRFQKLMLRKAVKVMMHCGFAIDVATVNVCASLPNDVLGLCKNGQIYIAVEAFERGQVALLGTLYEEWVHQTKRYDDYTNEFQNHLVDRVANFMLQIYEMERENVDSD